MDRFARAVHLFGIALFVGSICVYVIAPLAGSRTDLEALVVVRTLISIGTHYVTVPGLALAILSGAYLARGRFGVAWVRAKVVLGLAVAAVSAGVVVPAVDDALVGAVASQHAGRRLPAFTAPLERETIFGAINLLLTLTAAGVAIRRRGRASTTGLLRLRANDTPPLVLINEFTVDAGKETEFVQGFREIAALLAKAPGFRSTRLHRDGESTFVNYAEWLNRAAFDDALQGSEFRELAKRLPARARPRTFEIVTELAARPRDR